MGLNKPHGNMYGFAWTFSPFGGLCGCEAEDGSWMPTCDWCYVPNKFRWLKKYQGKPYYYYGKGKPLPSLKKNDEILELPPDIAQLKPLPIFLQPMGDIFHWEIQKKDRQTVFKHCNNFDNPYLILSKFPSQMRHYIGAPRKDYRGSWCFPPRSILGTTLETNYQYIIDKYSRAPSLYGRFTSIARLNWENKMISIEPILDFDLQSFVSWIKLAEPKFVAIGANSYRKLQLPEPSKEKVEALISELRPVTEVRLKHNLNYLGFNLEGDKVLCKDGEGPFTI